MKLELFILSFLLRAIILITMLFPVFVCSCGRSISTGQAFQRSQRKKEFQVVLALQIFAITKTHCTVKCRLKKLFEIFGQKKDFMASFWRRVIYLPVWHLLCNFMHRYCALGNKATINSVPIHQFSMFWLEVCFAAGKNLIQLVLFLF